MYSKIIILEIQIYYFKNHFPYLVLCDSKSLIKQTLYFVNTHFL